METRISYIDKETCNFKAYNREGKLLREETIQVGREYEIQPLYHLTKKNRGRKCVVLEIIDFMYNPERFSKYTPDEFSKDSYIRVRFLDTKRIAKIYEMNDLKTIGKVEAEYKRESKPVVKQRKKKVEKEGVEKKVRKRKSMTQKEFRENCKKRLKDLEEADRNYQDYQMKEFYIKRLLKEGMRDINN